MSDFLGRLAARQLDQAAPLRPNLEPIFGAPRATEIPESEPDSPRLQAVDLFPPDVAPPHRAVQDVALAFGPAPAAREPIHPPVRERILSRPADLDLVETTERTPSAAAPIVTPPSIGQPSDSAPFFPSSIRSRAAQTKRTVVLPVLMSRRLDSDTEPLRQRAVRRAADQGGLVVSADVPAHSALAPPRPIVPAETHAHADQTEIPPQVTSVPIVPVETHARREDTEAPRETAGEPIVPRLGPGPSRATSNRVGDRGLATRSTFREPAARPTPAPPADRAVVAPRTQTTVHVTIGRVEVRAVMPAAPPPRVAAPPSAPARISLEQYLEARTRRAGSS
jgi:hypothetical protein